MKTSVTFTTPFGVAISRITMRIILWLRSSLASIGAITVVTLVLFPNSFLDSLKSLDRTSALKSEMTSCPVESTGSLIEKSIPGLIVLPLSSHGTTSP